MAYYRLKTYLLVSRSGSQPGMALRRCLRPGVHKLQEAGHPSYLLLYGSAKYLWVRSMELVSCLKLGGGSQNTGEFVHPCYMHIVISS